MPIRYAPIERASKRARQQLDEVLRELINARHSAGLSQAQVASAIGVSRSLLASWEHGRITPSHLQVCRWGSAVGRDVSIRAFLADSPLHDAGQLRLLRKFRARIGNAWTCRTEVPVSPNPMDRRAVDAVLARGSCRVGVEAIGRLVDSQGQVRPILLKQEASGLASMILVLADSRHNREALRAGSATIAPAFPRTARETLNALRRGEEPLGNSVIVV